jgi:hypothetical protein
VSLRNAIPRHFLLNVILLGVFQFCVIIKNAILQNVSLLKAASQNVTELNIIMPL